MKFFLLFLLFAILFKVWQVKTLAKTTNLPFWKAFLVLLGK